MRPQAICAMDGDAATRKQGPAPESSASTLGESMPLHINRGEKGVHRLVRAQIQSSVTSSDPLPPIKVTPTSIFALLLSQN